MGMYDYIFLDNAASPSRGNGVKVSLLGTVAEVGCGHMIFKFHENGAEYSPYYISNAFTQFPSDSRYTTNTWSFACKFDWLISSDVTMTYQYLILLWLSKN